jgi:hypothetical protein
VASHSVLRGLGPCLYTSGPPATPASARGQAGIKIGAVAHLGVSVFVRGARSGHLLSSPSLSRPLRPKETPHAGWIDLFLVDRVCGDASPTPQRTTRDEATSCQHWVLVVHRPQTAAAGGGTFPHPSQKKMKKRGGRRRRTTNPRGGHGPGQRRARCTAANSVEGSFRSHCH